MSKAWTQALLERLAELWAEGHSTVAIGRQLGVSKNAVIGKARRLGLTARPSPIRRDPILAMSLPRARQHIPVQGSTLPPLASIAAPKVVPSKPVPIFGRTSRVETPAPLTEPSDTSEPRTIFRPRRPDDCCWPIGEPGTRGFRFCDDLSMPGKPYCDEHCQRAYVRVRQEAAV